MKLESVTFIGRAVDHSVPLTARMLDRRDFDGIRLLARGHHGHRSKYLHLDVGARPAAVHAEVVRHVQAVTDKPLCIHAPDAACARAALGAFDAGRCHGQAPMLDSISETRMGMLGCYWDQPFLPVFDLSDHVEHGGAEINRTACEVYRTACELHQAAATFGFDNRLMVFAPGFAPIGADATGTLSRSLEAMRRIRDDRRFAGAHIMANLCALTRQLPAEGVDKPRVRHLLECAFLTRALPLGLDLVVGSRDARYELLAEGHPALQCLDEALAMRGYDVMIRVFEFAEGNGHPT
ncbi:MAG: hypothetical protein CMJ18_18185 [Phycisphaeraceae bacterium]|nr:hypothetical protein [Phycisphaeraceae bacterium]